MIMKIGTLIAVMLAALCGELFCQIRALTSCIQRLQNKVIKSIKFLPFDTPFSRLPFFLTSVAQSTIFYMFSS
jgi:hypothetical protein